MDVVAIRNSAIQRVIVYYLKWLAIAMVISLVLLYIGRRLFAALSGDFAEEL